MKITLYRRFPAGVQRIVRRMYSFLPIEARMGKAYTSMKKFLRSAERWSEDEIVHWQTGRLKEIISHAYNTTPGYNQLFREANVSPDTFQKLDDIRLFPFVSKELLRDNLKEFTSTAVPDWKRLYRTTGGSTGIPFGFYLQQDDIEREMAFLNSAWERAGWKLGDVSAVFRGAFVGSPEHFWEYDPFLRDLRFSTYYLTEETYPRYKKKILSERPDHLQAYPSAATLLADLVLQNGDTGKIPFKLLLLGSENLYDWQKEKIISAFPSSKIFSWYGHAEQVLFAPMCEHSASLHLDPFYGLPEVIDDHNNEIDEGESGELVGTSLWNKTTPLIRYRTMDVARKGTLGCRQCGRNYRLLDKIDGRLQELIVTKSGRYISMTAINMHSDVFDNVKQFQFHQKEKGKVTFKIVKKAGYNEKNTEMINSELKKKLGNDVELELAFVGSIEKPQSGKFRFLIQEIPMKYGNHDRP